MPAISVVRAVTKALFAPDISDGFDETDFMFSNHFPGAGNGRLPVPDG